jgi:hypothetical protein
VLDLAHLLREKEKLAPCLVCTQLTLTAATLPSKQEETRMASMRPTAMQAVVLMACGLLMLSTTCQAGGIDENPRVSALLASRTSCLLLIPGLGLGPLLGDAVMLQ